MSAPGTSATASAILAASGKPLRLEDVEVVAGSGAVAFNRERFGGGARNTRARPRRK